LDIRIPAGHPPESPSDAVLWSRSGKATVLQDAGGHAKSEAVAINDAGQSVGFSYAASGYEAVLWSPYGKATVLHNAAGTAQSYANAINASGQSVGFSETTSFGEQAVLWSPSGKATSLGAMMGPAWTDTKAVGINNSGDIIGSGDYHSALYGFLLTPDSASPLSVMAAPELSTWTMMLLGFVGLGFAGYRRAKKGRATIAA
jgi:probable HAF family extracellular repeat protein